MSLLISVDQLKYTIYNDNTAIITGYESTIDNDFILNTNTINYSNNNYKITQINSRAFYNCKSTSFNFKACDYLNIVNSNSFYDCITMKSIILPDSVNIIGVRSFYNCSSLTSLTIPSTVTNISNNAFDSCTSLTSITFSGVIPSNLGTALLNNTTQSVTINYYLSVQSANFTTESIKGNFGNPNITFVNLNPFNDPNNLNPFNDPNNLSLTYTQLDNINVSVSATSTNISKSVNIPNNVTYNSTTYTISKINNNAFQGCSSLTSLTIPSTVTNIGNNAFDSCTSLLSITFSGQFPATLGMSLINNTSQEVNINYHSSSQPTGFTTDSIKTYFGTNVYFFNLDANNVACFHGSTEILCLTDDLKEEYVPIKNLSTDHKVKTYKEGYKKVKYIHSGMVVNNPSIYSSCMYKMKKTKNMTNDLIVTGGHSILVDKLSEEDKIKQKKYWGEKEYLINDKYLLLSAASNKFKKIEDNKLYMYYHLTLENDSDVKRRFGIWANGILTETMYS